MNQNQLDEMKIAVARQGGGNLNRGLMPEAERLQPSVQDRLVECMKALEDLSCSVSALGARLESVLYSSPQTQEQPNIKVPVPREVVCPMYGLVNNLHDSIISVLDRVNKIREDVRA